MRTRGVLVTICGFWVFAACSRESSGEAARVAEADLQPDAPDGYRLTLTGTVVGTGGVPAWAARLATATAEVRVRDGRGRVEFGRLAPPTLPTGTYLLVDAKRGETMVVVPAQREATRGASGVLTTMAMPNSVEVVDTVSTMEDLGAGKTVLGVPTRKVRVTFGYGLQARGAVNPPRWRNEFVTTFHVSERVAALDPVLARFSELTTGSLGATARTGMPAEVATLAQRRPAGFVMLQEQEAISITGRDTTRTVTSWRVTALKRGGVQTAELELPSGFTVRAPGDARTAELR